MRGLVAPQTDGELRSRPTAADTAPPRPGYHEVTAPSVRTVVILAAGNGMRMQARGSEVMSKPLVEVGGLALLERSLLTMSAAGIERFVVVVGHEHERLIEAMKRPSLQELHVEWVYCTEHERGNGVSLAAAAAEVDEPFLVSMADHVFDVGTVKRFTAMSLERGDVPQLAVDPNVAGVFDLDDATKVASRDGVIAGIGKQLADYDSIDMGLFYFPGGFGRRISEYVESGATSVSDIVNATVTQGPFGTVRLADAVWQDVDTRAMAREAERRLLASLRKPTDGIVSKLLNRPISLAVSRHLARWKVAPNSVTTFVTLLSLTAVPMVASTEYLWWALGGLIFQVASILDGCDGEVSRLTFRSSRLGGWYDTVSDNFRYGAFFVGLGIGAYRVSGNPIYGWATVVLAVLTAFTYTTLARYLLRTDAAPTHLVVTQQVESEARAKPGLWDRLVVLPLRHLIKQDVIALAALVLCVAGLPQVMFWLGVVGIIMISISVVRHLLRDDAFRPEVRRASFVALSLLAGIVILGSLFHWVELDLVVASVRRAGLSVLLAFAVAPLWLAANAMSLSVLLKHRIGFWRLLTNQLAGEAINTIVPLGGVAGEPYKVRHLGQWLSTAEASRAVLFDRVVHAVGGTGFSGLLLIAAAWSPHLPPAWRIGLLSLGAASLGAAVAMSVAALSRAPTRLAGWLAARVAAFRGLRELDGIGASVFARSLSWKLLGRAVNLLEVWVLFVVLSEQPTAERVLLVGAFVSAVNLIAFIFPQGIGATEASITGAFALLGLPAHVGLSFALIRRARVVVWALVGVALLLPIELWRWLSPSDAATSTART